MLSVGVGSPSMTKKRDVVSDLEPLDEVVVRLRAIEAHLADIRGWVSLFGWVAVAAFFLTVIGLVLAAGR